MLLGRLSQSLLRRSIQSTSKLLSNNMVTDGNNILAESLKKQVCFILLRTALSQIFNVQHDDLIANTRTSKLITH